MFYSTIRASAIDIHSRVRARTDSPGFGRGVDMGVIGYEPLLAKPLFFYDMEIATIILENAWKYCENQRINQDGTG